MSTTRVHIKYSNLQHVNFERGGYGTDERNDEHSSETANGKRQNAGFQARWNLVE